MFYCMMSCQSMHGVQKPKLKAVREKGEISLHYPSNRRYLQIFDIELISVTFYPGGA